MRLAQSGSSFVELLIFKKNNHHFNNLRWLRRFAVVAFVAALLGNLYIGYAIAPGVTNAEEASILFHSSSFKGGKNLEDIKMNTNHGKPPEIEGTKNSGQALDGGQADKLLAEGMAPSVIKNRETLPKSKNKSSLSSFFKRIMDRIKKIMQGMKERFRFFGNKKSKKGGDVRERVKLAGKAPEEEAKLTQNAPQYLRENMDYYENLNNHFRKPPGVEEYKSMRSHLELRTASPNYVELLNFFDGFLDSEGKIITKYSRSEFEGILEDFNLKFSELMLTEVESEMWRNALALVAFKVFDNNAIDLADSPNKYFREIMAALLVNSKAGHDNGMPNLSRYIYQKVLYDKIAEVHLVGKDIPYELSRIEIKGEYYDFYGHFFIGDRNFELSDDTALLTTQAKGNGFISKGIELFGSPGKEEQKSAHLKQLFQAISDEKIFENEEERFLAFKFIKWAHGKESNVILRKEIEYEIAGLALDSFLLLPNTHSNLKTSAEVAKSLKEAMRNNPYKVTESSNDWFVYPDWFSAGVSPIGKDYTEGKIIEDQISNIVDLPKTSYQKSFRLDSTLLARGIFNSFEKINQDVKLTLKQKEILLNIEVWETFKTTVYDVAKSDEFKTFLNRYENSQPKDKLEMIKYALLRCQSVSTKNMVYTIKNPLDVKTFFAQKHALEDQKMLWLQLATVKVMTFERETDPEGFTKLILEIAPQLDLLKNEANYRIDLWDAVEVVENFLKPVSDELASKLSVLHHKKIMFRS